MTKGINIGDQGYSACNIYTFIFIPNAICQKKSTYPLRLVYIYVPSLHCTNILGVTKKSLCHVVLEKNVFCRFPQMRATSHATTSPQLQWRYSVILQCWTTETVCAVLLIFSCCRWIKCKLLTHCFREKQYTISNHISLLSSEPHTVIAGEKWYFKVGRIARESLPNNFMWQYQLDICFCDLC